MKKVLQYLWKHPVWSSVIASVFIIPVLTFLINKLWQILIQIPLRSGLAAILGYMSMPVHIGRWLAILCLVFLISGFGWIVLRIWNRLHKYWKQQDEDEPGTTMPGNSASFFNSRLRKAFPSTKGLTWVEGNGEAVKRLNVIFAVPYRFWQEKDKGLVRNPIWWFRDGMSSDIHQYRLITNFWPWKHPKILLGHDEIKIGRIAAYISNRYYHSFLYVETIPDKPSGAYQWSREEIDERISEYGYCREEYALVGEQIITRAEYDDGAAIRKGKHLDCADAVIRIRYLSKYNFIISGQDSPFNTRDSEIDRQGFLGSVLSGEKTVDDIIEVVDQVRKFDIVGY